METTNFLIDQCFGQNKRYLVKHLLDSYDDFMLRKLDDIIDGFNPIIINHTLMPEENVYKYNLNIEIKNPLITKPIIYEKDGSSKVMTPKDARNRNFTYSSPIHVDLHITASTYNTSTQGYVEEKKKISNVCIGKIPIMVKSKYCVLNDKKNLAAQDECMYDYGGYFIVNGNEKVVISQDRIKENKPYVFINNKVSAYSHIAEIRSVQDNKFSVPKTTTLKLSNKPNQFGRFIRLNIHHVKHDVPLVVLFKALGVESDKEIAKHILFNCEDPLNAPLLAELAGSFEEGNHITCQREAIEYLAKYMNINHGYSKDVNQNRLKRLEIVRDVLTNELLPHVGTDYYKKALYLGYMVNKLLRCYMGIIPYDDRDSYINKRVDTPGSSLGTLFRSYFGKQIKDTKNMINKEIMNGSWKATMNFVDVINNVNINKIIKSSILEGGLKYSFATGTWGMRSPKTKQGVAQVLNHLTYNASLSHARRVNTPVDKSGKLILPRKLHGTQLGIVCPAETPEGVSVGLVKNLAMVASITIASNSMNIRSIIGGDLGAMIYDGTNLDIFKNSTKIIINGDMCGAHKQPHLFMEKIRQLKRSGTINVYTGISWNILLNEIIICTEAGRCIRPTVIIQDGKPLLTPELIDKYKKNKLAWIDLVIGNESIGLPSVVEYLDVEETNTAMIAMNKDDLETKGKDHGFNYGTKYTHMELDPSLMLGVLAGSIPFSDHNQAPRNCYQSAMGKQAVGIPMSNFRKRYDTMCHVLNYPQAPLVQTKVAKLVNNDKLPCGENVIVAIGCYTGYNQEDSIMMSQDSVDRGMFRSTYYRTYKEQNNKNHSTGEEEYFCKPTPSTTKQLKPFNYAKLGEDGFVPENTFVESGDIIIGKCMPQKNGNVIMNKDTSLVLKNNEMGFIDSNFYNDKPNITTNGDGYVFAKVRVRSDRIPCIGDKFCVPGNVEVITHNGWKYIKDVFEGEEILQMDPDTLIASYTPVVKKYKFHHNGPINVIQGKHIHLKATSEHKHFVYNSDTQSYGLKLSTDITPQDQFYKSCTNVVHPSGYTSNNYSDVAYIYGSFMAYGYIDVFPKRVHFGYTERLVSILEKLHIKYTNTGPDNIVTVKSEDHSTTRLYNFITDVQGYIKIEDWVYEEKNNALSFIQALFENNKRKSCSLERSTEYQKVALYAGLSADVTRDVENDRLYHVDLVTDIYQNVTIDEEDYNGYVYCVEVPSHVFLVRSVGKMFWTGNSSRHGQKGTVGMMYKQEDMPFTKDGLVPDIIINPHAIPSRMTIAQLMECIMGKACTSLGTTGDASPFTGIGINDIASSLESFGINKYGNEIMYNSRTGEQMAMSIFIGPTYYQRLKHMVYDKIHSRSNNGPIVGHTRQPAEGRARDGGLRIGEMEQDCLHALGVASFLKERFMDCSDNYRVYVCKKCEMIANVNPEIGLYSCKACKNTTHFAQVRIPYACKLLTQEVQTMAIGTRFKV